MPMKPAPTSYWHLFGFTLIEILITMAILVLLTGIPIVINYRTSRSNHALLASVEEFANQARTAHIYARETKDSNAWGLRKESETSYQIIAGSSSSPVIMTTLMLESQVKFATGDFVVWFNEGVGDTSANQQIEMENVLGNKARVEIHKTGLIETTGLY